MIFIKIFVCFPQILLLSEQNSTVGLATYFLEQKKKKKPAHKWPYLGKKKHTVIGPFGKMIATHSAKIEVTKPKNDFF